MEYFVVLFIPRNMVSGFKERKHFKGIRPSFIKPAVIIIEQFRLPVRPGCGNSVNIAKVEIVFDNMVGNCLNRFGNFLFLLFICNKVIIYSVCKIMPRHFIAGGFAQPFAVGIVLANVPFLPVSRAEVFFVGVPC